MAKKSSTEKNERRKKMTLQYAAKRKALNAVMRSPKSTDAEKRTAQVGLQKLPRNASPVRVRGRDAIDGRPRGFLSQFGVSRVRFRDMAHRGELPGITKSSW